MKTRAFPFVVAVFVLSLTGCGSQTGTAGSAAPPSTAASAPGAATVDVTLQEWAIVTAATTVAAGDVVFKITNTGPNDVHEFVVLKTDLDAGALPVDANGKVTEDAGGMEVVDEVEDLPVGQSRDLAVTLAPGKYVFICNIYDDQDMEAHYTMGMRIGFEVTG